MRHLESNTTMELITNTDQREEWNNFVTQEPSFSLLQSWEWGEFKKKLGWKVYRIAVQEAGRIIAGAQILIKSFPAGVFSFAYIPRGPIGNWLDEHTTPLLLSELHRIARAHRSIFLKIEPDLVYDPTIDGLLQQYHFVSTSYTNQPRATLILNLFPSLTDIWQQLRPTTKQRIRACVNKGVTVRIGSDDDLASFYNLMRITSKRGKFPSRTRSYYEQEWLALARSDQRALFMATYQDQLLAAHMVYRFGNHAAFFHSGSLPDSSKLHPNHLLVWEAIKWAKELGCHTYDLWGIPDEVGHIVSKGKAPPVSERTDGLWGVYQFKSGYSKNVVYYLGAYDYIYQPLFYKMITNKLININTMERFFNLIDKYTSP
jgi:lipid II:glycine glycyltransferase (peptidoglycan interpeptide bridge formation enzyme)